MTSTANDQHPGMMGDGTEEQNLGQTGNPKARIGKDEVEQAFGKGSGKAGAQSAGKSADQVGSGTKDAIAEDPTPSDSSPDA